MLRRYRAQSSGTSRMTAVAGDYVCADVRVDLLTREYPPEVYGGAGVHVEYLARSLRAAGRRAGALLRRHRGPSPGSPATPTRPSSPAPTRPCAPSASTWRWPPARAGADVVHSHTWYANLAGHLAKLLHGVPHVATAHSLEPLRPWKAEQLGGGYALSSWCERTALEAADAVIAVSAGMRADVLRRLPGGRPGPGARRPQRHRHRGVRARPGDRRADRGSASTRTRRAWSSSAGSPGRRACPTCCGRRASLPAEVQLVLLAGAPDTPEIAAEVERPRRRAAGDPRRRGLGAGDAAQARGDPGAHARDRLRLPVHLRADGHREPGGDGLRDGRRGHRDRRHPRGGRRRRDRPAGPDRAGGDGTARRSTRTRSSPTSPRALNDLLGRPGPGRRPWARRAGTARSSTSPGPAIAERTLERLPGRSIGQPRFRPRHNGSAMTGRASADRRRHARGRRAASTPPRRSSVSWSRSARSPTARATTRSACNVVWRGPDGGHGPFTRMSPRARHRPVARHDPARRGRHVDLHRRGVRRPVPDLAPRASPKKMDAGQGAEELANDLADRRRRARPGGQARAGRPGRSRWSRPPRRCATRRLALAERACPALDLAELLWQHPVRELVTATGRPADLGRPASGRCSPPGTSSSRAPRAPRSTGRAARSRTARSPPPPSACPAIAEMGFDVVYLPPIHPIGRVNRKGRNNALVARRERRRLAVGDRLGRGRPRRDPPAARHARGLPAVRRAGPRRSGWRWPWTWRCSARPTTRGSPSIRSGSPRCPTARSPTRRTRRRSTRTSTRSTSTTTPRASGPRSCGWCCTGSSRASRSSGWTTRTPSRSTSGTG